MRSVRFALLACALSACGSPAVEASRFRDLELHAEGGTVIYLVAGERPLQEDTAQRFLAEVRARLDEDAAWRTAGPALAEVLGGTGFARDELTKSFLCGPRPASDRIPMTDHVPTLVIAGGAGSTGPAWTGALHARALECRLGWGAEPPSGSFYARPYDDGTPRIQAVAVGGWCEARLQGVSEPHPVAVRVAQAMREGAIAISGEVAAEMGLRSTQDLREASGWSFD